MSHEWITVSKQHSAASFQGKTSGYSITGNTHATVSSDICGVTIADCLGARLLIRYSVCFQLVHMHTKNSTSVKHASDKCF